ncbi:MAG TPA: CDP-alcohol phosphatidyltransferase family protein [Vicinamibacterales bacterium]|nr:CDP-alcohol phosphatidyltransferase family protein [Vicinamibacterales bacterium]
MTTLAPPSSNTSTAVWLLPAPPLRARVLVAAGFGCLLVTVLGLGAQWWLGTAPKHPLVAVGVFTAMMATALIGMRDHHPFPRFGPANHVTMLRGVLVALAAGLIAEPGGSAVAWALVGATATIGVLDGVDGWLARRTRMSSAFGARFDMETDALFMLVLSVLVWRHDKAGFWVIAIGLMRYAFVAGGWSFPWLAHPLRSTRRGKAVAIGQIAALGLALLPVVPVPVSTLACGVALAALAWSFAIDVRFLYGQRARPDGRAL